MYHFCYGCFQRIFVAVLICNNGIGYVPCSIPKVDAWLEEQLKEAEENGYKPEENVNGFIGYVDCSLPVSKGNEKDGYDTYYLICGTKIIR